MARPTEGRILGLFSRFYACHGVLNRGTCPLQDYGLGSAEMEAGSLMALKRAGHRRGRSTRIRPCASKPSTTARLCFRSRSRARWRVPKASSLRLRLASSACPRPASRAWLQSENTALGAAPACQHLADAAFASREPSERQVWRVHVGSPGVRAICVAPERRLGFDRAALAAEPRIALLRWQR